MADVRPFRALRPAASFTERVAALPYDVYSRAEAYAAAHKEPLSFLNIDRPETQFPPDADMYAPEVYQKAHDMLAEQIASGIYRQDDKPCYYLYELTMNGRTQTGIVACSSVSDYENGIIKKHENTRAEKEADRIRHVDIVNAQTGPIFLAYRRDETLSALIRETKDEPPVFAFTSDDGIGHRGWMISDEKKIAVIREAFSRIPAVYIADGHHRAASAVRVGERRGEGEARYFLSVLFPDDQLMIMDYNRVVRDLNGMDEQTFLNKLEEAAEVTPASCAVRPTQKGTCGMYLGGKWYTLRFRKSLLSGDPVEGLDVSILQRHVLTPILGIGDPREDKRIDFVGGIRGMQELERRVNTDCKVAFSMYPTSIEELFAVADAGLLMPPKSTWFEPKLRSGLYIHLL